MDTSPRIKARLLGSLLLLAASSLSGCSGAASILDDPGVSLPAEPPQRTYSEEAMALNNNAIEVMFTDEAEATRLLDQAIALDPNYHMAFANKATLLISQKKYAEAIPCYERLSQLRPHVAEYYVGWAHCLHSMGKDAESKRRLRFAVAAYNKRLEKDSNEPWTLTSRALAAYLFGETEQARQEVARVLESDPGFEPGKQLEEEMQKHSGKDDRWKLLFD